MPGFKTRNKTQQYNIDFRKLKTDLDFAKAIFKICNNCDSAWDMDNDIVYVLKKFHVFKNKQDEKRK